MKAALKNVIELSTNKSVNKVLSEIHGKFNGEVSDRKWAGQIKRKLLADVDWNDPDFIDSLAVIIQREEKQKHTNSVPGSGRQIDFSSINPEWANDSGITLDKGLYVKFIDATSKHVFHYVKQRQKHAAESVDAAVRATELFELVEEYGSLSLAMKAKGVEGW